ncbi:MAG: hypothetical protein N2557_04085 [Hydrogenophilus sp.]|nr:hypothetical protein [Hydrogenophilus sp.]
MLLGSDLEQISDTALAEAVENCNGAGGLAFPHLPAEVAEVPKTAALVTGRGGRFMVFFGLIRSIFDIITYAMMWFVFSANTPEERSMGLTQAREGFSFRCYGW